jgi:hypothetical protein
MVGGTHKEAKMKRVKHESYESVWDAIADRPAEGVNLCARAENMPQIAVIEKEKMDTSRSSWPLRDNSAEYA